MIHVLVENKLYVAKSHANLVYRMWCMALDDSANKDEWVKNVKRRIQTLYRKKVGTRDYKSFVEDLDQMGLVRILRCRDCKNYDLTRTQDDPKATPCKENQIIIDPNISFCDLIDTPEIRIWRQAIEERKREKTKHE